MKARRMILCLLAITAIAVPAFAKPGQTLLSIPAWMR